MPGFVQAAPVPARERVLSCLPWFCGMGFGAGCPPGEGGSTLGATQVLMAEHLCSPIGHHEAHLQLRHPQPPTQGRRGRIQLSRGQFPRTMLTASLPCKNGNAPINTSFFFPLPLFPSFL